MCMYQTHYTSIVPATHHFLCDWPHETGPEAVSRNRKGVANFLKIVKSQWRGESLR
jgi:hypothetical protein